MRAFWIVMCDDPLHDARYRFARHAHYSTAKNEAERLVQRYGRRFFVMEVVLVGEPAPKTGSKVLHHHDEVPQAAYKALGEG